MTSGTVHPNANGRGRVFVVWNDGKTNVEAEFARLAGPGGRQPEDLAVVIRWLSEGEPPPPQEQNRWPEEFQIATSVEADSGPR